MNIFRNIFFSVLAVSGMIVLANEGPKKDESPSGETGEVVVKAAGLVADVAVKETIENGFLSKLGGHVASLVYLPVACIDKVSEKVWINNMVNRVALFSFLPNKIGGWLTKHNKGLSRSIVVAIVGCAGYCVWKKYKKSEQEAKRFRQECEECDLDQDFEDWNDLFDDENNEKTGEENLNDFNDEDDGNVDIID